MTILMFVYLDTNYVCVKPSTPVKLFIGPDKMQTKQLEMHTNETNISIPSVPPVTLRSAKFQSPRSRSVSLANSRQLGVRRTFARPNTTVNGNLICTAVNLDDTLRRYEVDILEYKTTSERLWATELIIITEIITPFPGTPNVSG